MAPLLPAVRRFRARSRSGGGACGDNITLNLGLRDGATNLGAVSYTMRMGGVPAPTSPKPLTR